MKVEILSDVMISGEPVLTGSIIEVSRADALLLIGSNKARLSSAVEPATEEAAQPAEPAPPTSATKRSRKSEPPTEA